MGEKLSKFITVRRVYKNGSHSHTAPSGNAISLFYRNPFMVTKFPVLCSDRTASHSCMTISNKHGTFCHVGGH